jgi:hypothetical protein
MLQLAEEKLQQGEIFEYQDLIEDVSLLEMLTILRINEDIIGNNITALETATGAQALLVENDNYAIRVLSLEEEAVGKGHWTTEEPCQNLLLISVFDLLTTTTTSDVNQLNLQHPTMKYTLNTEGQLMMSLYLDLGHGVSPTHLMTRMRDFFMKTITLSQNA